MALELTTSGTGAAYIIIEISAFSDPVKYEVNKDLQPCLSTVLWELRCN